MRILLAILLTFSSAFALDALWGYDSSATDTTYPKSTTTIYTVPANGTYGYPVDSPVYFVTPRICTNTYPQGWYGNDQHAAYYSQGQYFNVIDTINQSAAWTFGFDLGSTPFDWKDTVAVCKTQLFDQEWVTHPIDTFYRTTTFNTDTAYFLTETCAYLGNDGCDSCAFIVFCDTTLPTIYDTFSIARERDWPPFYQVEWFVRQLSQSDSFYFDTLRYVTEGDTAIIVSRAPYTVVGQNRTGTANVVGMRSAGMDVYANNMRVVTAVDSAEINKKMVQFSFQWSGLREATVESLSVYGVSSGGDTSATRTIFKRYVNINSGTHTPR